jgi:hypothetical protein
LRWRFASSGIRLQERLGFFRVQIAYRKQGPKLERKKTQDNSRSVQFYPLSAVESRSPVRARSPPDGRIVNNYLTAWSAFNIVTSSRSLLLPSPLAASHCSCSARHRGDSASLRVARNSPRLGRTLIHRRWGEAVVAKVRLHVPVDYFRVADNSGTVHAPLKLVTRLGRIAPMIG